jgi:hypothetical protein
VPNSISSSKPEQGDMRAVLHNDAVTFLRTARADAGRSGSTWALRAPHRGAGDEPRQLRNERRWPAFKTSRTDALLTEIAAPCASLEATEQPIERLGARPAMPRCPCSTSDRDTENNCIGQARHAVPRARRLAGCVRLLSPRVLGPDSAPCGSRARSFAYAVWSAARADRLSSTIGG